MTLARNSFVVATVALVDLAVIWGIFVGGYPLGANVLPALAAATMTLLCIPIVWGGRGYQDRAAKSQPSAAVSLPGVAWMAAFLPVVYLLGFRLGLPLYALTYAASHNVKPAHSILLSLSVSMMVEILFVRALGLLLPSGWILDSLYR